MNLTVWNGIIISTSVDLVTCIQYIHNVIYQMVFEQDQKCCTVIGHACTGISIFCFQT